MDVDTDSSTPTADAADIDRTESPATGSQEDPVVVLVLGVPDAARRRLADSGDIELIDDLADATGVDAVLVSTRLGRAELRAVPHHLDDLGAPVIGLAHTGGEGLAVELLRVGAATVVAEGNEAAVVATIEERSHDTGFLDAYTRHLGLTATAQSPGVGRDATTAIADRSRFEEVVDELVVTGECPRVGFLHLPRLTATRLTETAMSLLLRRLAAQFREATERFDTQLFAVARGEFAVVGPTLSPKQSERLFDELQAIASSYTAGDGVPLSIALGHAGPEVTEDATLLRELAQRALQVATLDPTRRIIGAASLSAGASAATELETARRLVAHVERHTDDGEGHGVRVARHAAELATALGLESTRRTTIELAARLHDIGKAGLPQEAMNGPAGLVDELREAHHTHPVRGWRYLRTSAGEVVADAVRGQHEHWDGSGFPDALQGADIPFEARLLAAAHAVEEAVVTGQDAAMVRRLAGGRLDPELAETAAQIVEGAAITDRGPVPAA